MLEIVARDAAAETDVEPAGCENIEHAAFLGQTHRVVKRKNIDQVTEPQVLGARREGGDDQVGRGQHAIVGVMVLGKPSVVETEPLGEQDLLEQFLKGLFFRHPRARLIVAESSEPHASFLQRKATKAMTIKKLLGSYALQS